jgi:hypothetical protein
MDGALGYLRPVAIHVNNRKRGYAAMRQGRGTSLSQYATLCNKLKYLIQVCKSNMKLAATARNNKHPVCVVSNGLHNFLRA